MPEEYWETTASSIKEFKKLVRYYIKQGFDIENVDPKGVFLRNYDDHCAVMITPDSSDESSVHLLKSWLKTTFVRRMRNPYNCRFMAIYKSEDRGY